MLTTDLYPYQTRVSEFAKEKARVGMFVFYGGGKTYLSLRWWEAMCSKFPSTSPVLILTMKSLIHQWGKEIEKHIGLTYSLVIGTAAQRLKALKAFASFYVINYDAVRSAPILQVLRHMHFGTVIADESTMLKEARTQRFKMLRSVIQDIPHRAILTGKPILERPEEIWSQLLFLDDGETFSRSFWKFRDTYFSPGPPWAPYDWTLKPNAGQQIAAALNKKCIRVDKEEIMTELPPKRYIKIHFQMPERVRESYEQLRKEFSMELLDGTTYETMWAMGRAQKMHQLCQGVFYREKDKYELVHTLKLDWLQENIPLMLQNGPVLIWTHFVRLIPLITAQLTPLRCVIYTGEISQSQRVAAVQAFQNGKADVLVLSEQAGCAGLNLQRANQAVFVSTGYWAGSRENAEGRCHRLGSEMHEAITYYDLVVEKSIDEVVLKAIAEKQDIADAILQHIKTGGEA